MWELPTRRHRTSKSRGKNKDHTARPPAVSPTLAIHTSTKILSTRYYTPTHDGTCTLAPPHIKRYARRLTSTNRPLFPLLESPRRGRLKRREENLRIGHTLCHREGGRRSVCRIVTSKSSSPPRSSVTMRIRRRGVKSLLFPFAVC